MLHFRTVLLWLAFILIALQQFWDYNSNIELGIIYRLLPSGILLLWFIISIFIKEKVKIKVAETPKAAMIALRVFRPLAGATIVGGALFKIMHWPYGNIMLAIGIGFMAIYSTALGMYAIRSTDEPDDIIDDLES